MWDDITQAEASVDYMMSGINIGIKCVRWYNSSWGKCWLPNMMSGINIGIK